MKEKPILMNTEMVLATLAGRKTETRRIIKFPDDWVPLKYEGQESDYLHSFLCDTPCGRHSCGIKNPWAVDQLWVREAWASKYIIQGNYYGPSKKEDVIYRTGNEKENKLCNGVKWKPSIHMFRWASRIQLLVKEVKVERVQDITERGAVDEGCPFEPGKEIRTTFQALWDRINKKRGYGWEVNAYVWVIKFEMIKPLPRN